MAKLAKILLLLVVAVIGIGVVAGVALIVFFDPNDFRGEVSEAVKEATGRELVIEGDLSLSIFPWIAIDIGRTELGNAEGFADEPFLSFDNARLSVRLMPLLLQRQIAIDTASLDGFALNLAVAQNGVTNWDDLASAGQPAAAAPAGGSGSSPINLDVQNIVLSHANVVYSDLQSNSRYTISDLTVETGRIVPGQPSDIAAEFSLEASPGDMGGHVSISATIEPGPGFQQIALSDLNVSGDIRGVVAQSMQFNFDARAMEVDTAGQRVTLGEMDLSALGISMSANVEPFSYAATPQPQMTLRVNEFSLKELLQTMGSEAPVTADPNALQRISFSAHAAVSETAIALSDMTLQLDDTTMTGKLSLPATADGALTFVLSADSINLDPYMAPASEEDIAMTDTEEGDIEIPVETIRALNASGSIKLAEAYLSGLKFENMQLGINSAGGKLRLYPIAADLFDGKYAGDVRVDASGDVPSIAVNESVAGVSLTPLALSMFEQENIAGTINGNFVLSGSGANVAAIQQDLDGTMSFELLDGEWQGTDVWHQLRSARAAFRGETAPQVRTPVRTEFTSVTVSGNVNDGVFTSDDLLAELPFMQLTGNGSVDLTQATVDYSLLARVLDRPELQGSATADELADFSKAQIPLSVTGPLSAPSVRPDIESMVRQEVQRQVEEKTEDLKKQVLDSLFGGDEPAQEGGTENQDGEEPEDEQSSPEDEVKDALKKLFRQ